MNTLQSRREALSTGNPVSASETYRRNLLTKFGNPSRKNVVTHYDNGAEVFHSYGTVIAARVPGLGYRLSRAWNFSATTSQYRNQFLGETTPVTRERLQTGETAVMDDHALIHWAVTA